MIKFSDKIISKINYGGKKIIKVYDGNKKLLWGGLDKILFSQTGIFTPSVYGGRTSAATLENGTEVNPEELRVGGMRRVENNSTLARNLVPYGGATKVETSTDVYEVMFPNGSNKATRLRIGKTSHYSDGSPSGVRFKIDLISGSSVFNMSVSDKNPVSMSLVSGSTYYFNTGGELSTHCFLDIWPEGVGATTAVISELQFFENSNNADSYVDPSIDYGYNVPGVNYFPYENGNTVDANGIVTEGVGAALPEPYYYLLEGGATNLIANPLLSGLTGSDDTHTLSSWSLGPTFARGGYTVAGFPAIRLRRGTVDYQWLYQYNSLNDSLNYTYTFYAEYNSSSPSPWIFVAMGRENVVSPAYSYNVWIDLSAGTVGASGGSGSIAIKAIDIDTYKITVHSSDGVHYPLISPVSGDGVIANDPANSAIFPNTGTADYNLSHTFSGFQLVAGTEVTTFTSSIRTDDKVITIPNILPSDNPQIRTIDSNGDVITEPVFGGNLVINGDFSDGLTGWAVYDHNTDGYTSIGIDGSGDLELNAGGYDGVYRNLLEIIETGKKYLISITFGAIHTDNFQRFRIYNRASFHTLFSGNDNKTSGEQTFFTYTATQNISEITIGLNGGGVVRYRDVDVRSIHPLCSYDPDTQILTVRPDTSVNAKIVIG